MADLQSALLELTAWSQRRQDALYLWTMIQTVQADETSRGMVRRDGYQIMVTKFEGTEAEPVRVWHCNARELPELAEAVQGFVDAAKARGF